MSSTLRPIKGLIDGLGHITAAVRASREYQRLNRLPANAAQRSSLLSGFLGN